MPLFSRPLKPESGDATPAADATTAYFAHGRIGELLRQTRQSYGGDVAQIATILRIRAGYLTAIEESRYEDAIACFEEAKRLGHPKAAEAILLCKGYEN